MVIDSSAFVAILLGEPEQSAFIDAIVADTTRIAGVPTVLETSMVILSRRGEIGLAEFRAFQARADVRTVAFGPEQLDLALDAFRRFGKGRHPAGLTYGDCFSYALAKAAGEPLLFKGEDFPLTDITAALSNEVGDSDRA
jgi:ribonuclease VapC